MSRGRKVEELFEAVQSIEDPDKFRRVIDGEPQNDVLADLRDRFCDGSGDEPWQVIEINRLIRRRQEKPQVEVFNRIENIIVGFFVFFGRLATTTWQLGRRPANVVRFAANTSGTPLATRPFTYLVVSSFLASQFVRKVVNTYDYDIKALASDTHVWLEALNVTAVLMDSVATVLIVGGLAYLLGFLLTLRVSTDQRSEKRQTAVRLVCYATGFQFVLTLVWGCVWIGLVFVWPVVISLFGHLDDIMSYCQLLCSVEFFKRQIPA